MDLALKAKSLTGKFLNRKSPCYSLPLGGCDVQRFEAISAHGRDTGVLDCIHHTFLAARRGAKSRKAPPPAAAIIDTHQKKRRQPRSCWLRSR